MREGIITMSQRDLNRIQVISKVKEKEVRQKQAAEVLGLSERQIRRIVRRVKKEGARGIIHRLRGCSAHNKIDSKIREQVLKVYEKKYQGFGAKLLSEKLQKIDGIKISKETLRHWLISEGYQQKKRRRKKHRQWRLRKEYYGQMIQMDGSHHDWLEDRGPRLVLMGYIDDATNRVYARFYEYEGTIPALDSFKRYAKRHGVPQSVYLDRHSTYKVTHYDQWKAKVFGDEDPTSQFERALKELGVKVIHANSAPAKGRIERLFRTLQDRLVKELRLSNAKTLDEANETLEPYLRQHNSQFMVEPVRRADLHRRAPKTTDLDKILCIKTNHPLRNDFTVLHKKKLYQIMEYTGAKQTEVRELVNGRMEIIARGRKLNFKEIEQLPVKKRIRLNQRSPIRTMPKNHSFGTFRTRSKEISFY
jgi:transposase